MSSAGCHPHPLDRSRSLRPALPLTLLDKQRDRVGRGTMENTQPSMTQSTTGATGTQLMGAQRRVLVVEDDPTIADAISVRLRAEGFQVHTAGDGPSAVDTAYAWQP